MIRPYRSTDADAVVGVWRSADLVRSWNDPHRDIARKLTVSDGLFLVAEEEGEVVGTAMAGYDGHRGWIYYLAVLPEHQRHGFGRALVKEAEQRLLERGCAKVNLQVRSGNDAVVDFYRGLGYSADEVVSLGKRLIPDD